MTMWARIREANAPPPAEDSVALRAAVFVAVLIATLGALDLNVGSSAIRVACVVGLPIGYVLSHALRRRSRGWLKALLAVAAIAAFIQFIGLFAPALAGQVFGLQAGLVELLLSVQVLHSLDLPARRDLLFSLGVSGALVIVSATLATTDRFGLVLVLWGAAALIALSIANLNQLGITTERARRTKSVPFALLAIGGVGVLLLGVLPPAKVFAFGLPARAGSGGVPTGGQLVNPAFSALPSAAGQAGGRVGTFGYFGYMDSLDLGFRGRPDDTIVMRVRAPGPDYWRAQTFDRYDGQRWTQSDTRLQGLFGTNGLRTQVPVEDSAALIGDEFIQTFYVTKVAPNIVFAAATPTRVYWPFDEAYQLSDGTLRGGDTLARGTVYSVVSRRLPVTPTMLRAHDPRVGGLTNVGREIYTRYTTLPTIPDRVRALAHELAASAPTTYDAIQAMTGWIAANTKYSLNPPRLGSDEDAVEQFLFDDQRGFCEQIASSLVVMLRAIGVPARVAVGYAAGTRNPFTGLYEVKASNAHAYAEVLFPGVGWQAFDPTASVPLAGDAAAFPAFAGAGLTTWLSDHAPSARTAQSGAAGVVVVASAVAIVPRWQRWRRRSWLDTQLARLERRSGVAIPATSTLPDWLASLPPDQHARYRGVVAALEHEAWGASPLADEDRRAVEAMLATSNKGP